MVVFLIVTVYSKCLKSGQVWISDTHSITVQFPNSFDFRHLFCIKTTKVRISDISCKCIKQTECWAVNLQKNSSILVITCNECPKTGLVL